MKKVMIFGTFDGIHKGHLDLFRQAKKYGDYLVVSVARDVNVKKVKNKLPVKNENERLKDLQNCPLIEQVLLGYEDNPYRIIGEVKPDIICLGYDQSSFTEKLEEKLKEMGLKPEIHRLKPYQPEKYHSSIINKKS